MTPTPEQVAQWALDAGISEHDAYPKPLFVGHDFNLHRLVTRAMAEQAEADAKVCEKQAHETSTVWAVDKFTEHAYRDGMLQMMQIPMNHCAAAIRANAPKVTT